MTNTLPRSIAPELIREGDKISVKLPPERGLTIRHEGVVAEIEDYAGGRFFKTAEGTRIAVYVPGRHNPSRYTLVAREETQVSLW
ncbi:hypothetical protein Curie_16 [Microbacterium phage Curie]